jgi:hypothetical protein
MKVWKLLFDGVVTMLVWALCVGGTIAFVLWVIIKVFRATGVLPPA